MLDAIKARLESLKDEKNRPLLNQVDTAMGLANVRSRPLRGRRAAFVVPLSDRPGGNQRAVGEPLQQVTHQVGIVLVLRGLEEDSLQALRQRVRQALFGWQPLPQCDPMLLGNGDLYGMSDGQLWWLDRFTTSQYLEADHG